MEKIKKDYYANEKGHQLRDFMKQMHALAGCYSMEIYSLEDGFFFLNAVKYKVRAGLKDENTFQDDMTKYKDYLDDLEELGVNRDMLLDSASDYVNRFYAWGGQTGSEFIEFMDSFGHDNL